MNPLHELDQVIGALQNSAAFSSEVAALDGVFDRLASTEGQNALRRVASLHSRGVRVAQGQPQLPATASASSAPVDYLDEDVDLSDLDLR